MYEKENWLERWTLRLQCRSLCGGLTHRQAFSIKFFRRKSNEKPWITPANQRKSKKKRRLFRKHGRSAAWRALTKNMVAEVRFTKEEFVDNTMKQGV